MPHVCGQEFPGFLICPKCGLTLDNPNQPHRDPGTGNNCRGNSKDRSVLLHHFNTAIALLGVALPPGMSANPATPGGRAAWLSVGTALRQGAAAHLQIDPEELAMGVRPWFQPGSQGLSAEVFIYDTLPNGAGYAAEVAADLEPVLRRALNIAEHCSTPCTTACYRCLLEYGNNLYHPLLDRFLAGDVLRFMLDGTLPQLAPAHAESALKRLEAFAQGIDFTLTQDVASGTVFARLRNPQLKRTVGLVCTHTLQPQEPNAVTAIQAQQAKPVFASHFDLTRRPFWVWNKLRPILDGQSDVSVLES